MLTYSLYTLKHTLARSHTHTHTHTLHTHTPMHLQNNKFTMEKILLNVGLVSFGLVWLVVLFFYYDSFLLGRTQPLAHLNTNTQFIHSHKHIQQMK